VEPGSSSNAIGIETEIKPEPSLSRLDWVPVERKGMEDRFLRCLIERV
jgi:hypothetical protein